MSDLTSSSRLTTRLARSKADLQAAQRLRYLVFVTELGGDGPLIDHKAGLEIDGLDPFADHLLLIDPDRPSGEDVVGAYRLLRSDMAARSGGFYSRTEYDLGPLVQSGRSLLELGRSCLHPEYRGGMGMYHLWTALAAYVATHRIEILFGVASFHGTDPAPLAASLSLLHHRHLAPEPLRARALPPGVQPMNLLPEATIDRRRAMRDTPALIKAYLRLGGMVGEGAWIDRAFNTTDVCMILDVAAMNPVQRGLYEKGGRA